MQLTLAYLFVAMEPQTLVIQNPYTPFHWTRLRAQKIQLGQDLECTFHGNMKGSMQINLE